MNKYGISMGGKVKKSSDQWAYQGRLLNPLTWLKWSRIWCIEKWEFIEASYVLSPIDTHCKIHKD